MAVDNKTINVKDEIILERLVEAYGADTILKLLDKSKFKRNAIAVATAATLLGGATMIKNNINNAREKQAVERHMSIEDQIPNYQEKVDALSKYMNIAALNLNFDPTQMELKAEDLIKAAYEHNFDLPTLVSFAHLESAFGNTARAKRTNSIFSIGAYDNGTDKVTYNTQKECIEPFINIMQQNYGLTSEDAIINKLKNKKLVNGIGKRYASDPNYEKKILSVRNSIIDKYPILADRPSTAVL